MRRFWAKVQSPFRTHEIWALRMAKKFPFIAPFFFFTLWFYACLTLFVGRPFTAEAHLEKLLKRGAAHD